MKPVHFVAGVEDDGEVIRSRLVAMVVVLFCLFKGFATTFEKELVPFAFGESVLGFRVIILVLAVSRVLLL